MTAASKAVRAARQVGRVPATLEGHLAAALRTHFNHELPRNRNRGKRNGDGMPLSAWMLGANRSAVSKIQSVTDGTARYPYGTKTASIEALMWRIAERYQITTVQASLLCEHLNSRYSGRIDCIEMSVAIGLCGEYQWGDAPSRCAIDALRAVCAKIKKPFHLMPLRAILDPCITNLLLLIQLDGAILCAKKQTPLHPKRTTK